MPNVDDHMDDLFRKAAEQYPLKTTGADWDAVQGALTGNAKLAASNKPGRIKYLVLLLLILAGSAGIYYFTQNSKDSVADELIEKNIAKNETMAQPKDNSTKGIAASKNVQPGNIVKNKPVEIVQNKPEANNNRATSYFSKRNKQDFLPGANSQSAIRKMDKLFDNASAKFMLTITPGEKAFSPENEQLTEDKAAMEAPVSGKSPKAKGTADEDSTENFVSINQKKKANSKFYLGVNAGVELNKVKQQQMTKVGFNIGLVAGLRLHPQLALETGVNFSRKKYYSSGQFFNPKTGSMPAGMTVMSLDGKSTLFEIPLTLKYNFTKIKNGFYAIGGTSSYLLVKEQNVYHAMMSGQPTKINSTYTKSNFYPISTINFGVGYQHSLKTNAVFRLEPYMQIPLRGIGVGLMPVTSAGLHFVITN